MPKPRRNQIALSATPYYHCISRCVRRAFLCGKDAHTGRCFEHRRGWIEQRLLKLAGIFAIDIAAYAVMSNHLHLVLHINTTTSQSWTQTDIIHRWHALFAGNSLSKRAVKGETLGLFEQTLLNRYTATWQARLTDISWFMRCLNEPIARLANREDQATGRFWEGRFKTQALLDEQALMACMAYVDLNPIRAKMASTPESSDFTAIQRRILHLQTAVSDHTNLQPPELMPFVGNPREDMPAGLPFRLQDYIECVDWTGRVLRSDKRGAIAASTPSVLNRLGISAENWLALAQSFGSKMGYFAGVKDSVIHLKETLKLKRVRTQGCGLFST